METRILKLNILSAKVLPLYQMPIGRTDLSIWMNEFTRYLQGHKPRGISFITEPNEHKIRKKWCVIQRNTDQWIEKKKHIYIYKQIYLLIKSLLVMYSTNKNYFVILMLHKA